MEKIKNQIQTQYATEEKKFSCNIHTAQTGNWFHQLVTNNIFTSFPVAKVTNFFLQTIKMLVKSFPTTFMFADFVTQLPMYLSEPIHFVLTTALPVINCKKCSTIMFWKSLDR